MKRILLPTDFSDNSYKAICYAMELYRHQECTFFLFNVHGPSALYLGDSSFVSATMAGQVEEVIRQQTQKNLEELEKRVKGTFINTKHSVQIVAKFNFFLEGVNEIIKEENINLIVMGTKGASGLKEMVMGSNTGHVLSRVNVPVLVVPEDARCTIPINIGFVSDYQHEFEKKELLLLLEMANLWKSKVHILHINGSEAILDENKQRNKRMLEGLLSNIDHKFYNLTNVSLETGVNNFVELLDIHLVSMVSRSRSFLERLLFIPKVVSYSFHTNTPFLVLKD